MRAEYDFSSSKGVRGKYYKRLLKGAKIQITHGSGNVFFDLGFDEVEAKNLQLRSELLMRIQSICKQMNIGGAKGAKRLGLTGRRFDTLLRGRLGAFTLDALVNVATRAGLKVRLEVREAD